MKIEEINSSTSFFCDECDKRFYKVIKVSAAVKWLILCVTCFERFKTEVYTSK